MAGPGLARVPRQPRGDQVGGSSTPIQRDRERALAAGGDRPGQLAAAATLGLVALGAALTLRQALRGAATPHPTVAADLPALVMALALTSGARLRLQAGTLAALGGRPRYGLVWQIWPPTFRAFAHDHGRRYRRDQMMLIRAIPIVPSVALLTATVAAPPWLWLWLAAAVTAGACATDLRGLGRLLRLPPATVVEDHKDGWLAWPPAAPATVARLRVVRVADLPWPRTLHRCAHRDRLRRALAVTGPDRFLSSARYATVARSTSERVLGALGGGDLAACPYHDADWPRVAAVAVAVVEGRAPDDLPLRDARWLTSLILDPIAWDQGAARLDNGQHRVCALRAAGVERCVAAGLAFSREKATTAPSPMHSGTARPSLYSRAAGTQEPDGLSPYRSATFGSDGSIVL